MILEPVTIQKVMKVEDLMEVETVWNKGNIMDCFCNMRLNTNVNLYGDNLDFRIRKCVWIAK